MMHSRKTSPRAEHRLSQFARVNASASLAEKFPRLKSLTVDLDYFDPSGVTRNGGVKFKANIANAQSVVCFNCPNGECAGGDYDLSDELARAISARRKLVTGEMRCRGVRLNREKKQHTPCRNLLRYTLRLAYA